MYMWAAVFFAAFIGVALLLMRLRNRLNGGFGRGQNRIASGRVRAVMDFGDGGRVAVIDIDGVTLACALTRGGVTSMLRLDDAGAKE